jgi:putative transposase
VEELMAERGVDVSYETIRLWWNRFGPEIARTIRKSSQASSRWAWHLDEVFVRINGKRRYLWRAVDHEGEVLDGVATEKRDKAAALRLLRKLFKWNGAPAKIVTVKLRSYPAALRELRFSGDRCTGKWANNRADVSPVDSPARTGDAAIFGRWRRCSCRGDSRSSSESFQP